MAKKPKAHLLIAIPTRGTVRTEWAVSLATLAMPVGPCAAVTRVIAGVEVDEARNIAATIARDLGAEYLLFLDDDVTPPPQAIRRFVWLMGNNPDWDLLSGIVPIKSQPIEPCVFREGTIGPYWDWTFDEQFEIDACGMAFCMIRTRAFEMVDEPWFAWKRRYANGGSEEEGEDVGFCRRLKAAGGVLMADGGLLCGHLDDEGRLYQMPYECAPIQRGKDALENFHAVAPDREVPVMNGVKS